jgi:hypothetical protein
VDGVQVEIKIVEEWGYAMGEDTCLFEEENGSESSQDDDNAGHDEPEARCNVDLLVENIVDEVDDVDVDAQGACMRMSYELCYHLVGSYLTQMLATT